MTRRAQLLDFAQRVNALAVENDLEEISLSPFARMSNRAMLRRIYSKLSEVTVARGDPAIEWPTPFRDNESYLSHLSTKVRDVEDSSGGELEYLILSTDWATDCDDALGLGIMVRALSESPSKRLIAVVTDSQVASAAPSVAAALEAFGLESVPVGAYKGATGPSTSTYAANVAYMWGHGGETRDDFPSASTVLRQALDELPVGAKVTVIVTGTLGALYEFVQSEADEDGIAASGAELFSERVLRVVDQGPNWSDNLPRYNWEQNETAASHFTTNAATYGVPFVILPADEGDNVFTGPPVEWSQYDNPIARAFALSSSQLTNGERQAWDPLTIYYALFPDNPIWAWHRQNCSVTYDTGANTVTKGAADSGLFSWINLSGTNGDIGDELSAYVSELSAPAAPFYANAGRAVLDFPFEGADGSTSVTDITFMRAATVVGATIENDFAETGGITSLHCSVAGEYVQLADSVDWSLGSSPFTIQLRGVRFASLATANKTLINQWTPTGNQRSWILEATTSGALSFTYSTSGATGVTNASAGGIVTTSVSYDIDLVRTAGNDIKIFLNGVEVLSVNIGTALFFASTGVMRVGYRNDNVNGFTGYIGRARLLKGVAETP